MATDIPFPSVAFDPDHEARKLSKAAQTALFNMTVPGWRTAPHDGWRRAGQAMTVLCNKGFAERRFEKANGLHWYRLTPAGQEVRTALASILAKDDQSIASEAAHEKA